jgi:DDE superfamily endonuclease
MVPPANMAKRKTVVMVISAAFVAATAAVLFSELSIQKPVHRAPAKRRRRLRFSQLEAMISDAEFTRAFRIPREAFHSLCRTLRLDLFRDEAHSARSRGDAIETAARLAVTLRMLTGASYLNLVMLFRVAKATIYDIFHSTADIINRRLQMPGVPIGNSSKLFRLAEAFSKSRTPPSPLYGCVGALDGIAIAIVKPPDEFVPRNFYCRKGMYCLPVQAVVDSTYRFLYMSANCVGSTHDSLSFTCSRLGQILLGGGALGSFWIAADAAYDCGNGLITPWSKGQLLDERQGLWRDRFNYLRIHVEQGFGMLVSRFGILWKPMRFNFTRVAEIVAACMRLHNYCIDMGIPNTSASMTPNERAVSDAAFHRWWSMTTAQRDDLGDGQGRRSDLHTSDMRQELTNHLAERCVTRPR